MVGLGEGQSMHGGGNKQDKRGGTFFVTWGGIQGGIIQEIILLDTVF